MQNVGHRHAIVFAAPLIFVQRQLFFSNKRLHFQSFDNVVKGLILTAFMT